MTVVSRRVVWLLIPVIVGTLVICIGAWLTVVMQRQTLESPLANIFPWPVACSLRGCITTHSWRDHLAVRRTFATTAQTAEPSAIDALTTLIRQHMVSRAFLRVPVGLSDAVRYREEVLGLHDEAAAQEATHLTLDQYDRMVILPLLQQEALRQERAIESLEELFVTLAKERRIVVFGRLKWNREEARVEER